MAQHWVEGGSFDPLTNRFTSGLTYDAAGNVTADSRFRHRSYLYDANGRQRRSSNPDGSDAVVSVYDGAGQRVATKAGGALAAVFVYDASGVLAAEYGVGAPVPAGTRYVMGDHQGSTRVVMNATGANGGVVSRRDYLPFGEDVPAGVGMRATTAGYGQADGVRQRYAGMEGDEATGMSHTLWREFDSLSARWTTPDPYGGSMDISSPQTFNRYTYVNNDPVNKIDPTGLMLSDIGVYQTGDAGMAHALELRSLGNHLYSTNAAYRQSVDAKAQERQSQGTASERSRDAFVNGMVNAAVQKKSDLLFNPQNCFQYAVIGSPGIARPFDANSGPDGRVFHDGAHALSPMVIGVRAPKAVTLPALAGEVIYSNVQEHDDNGKPLLYTVDVRPTSGNFIGVYKDLISLTFPLGKKGILLGPGDMIGTVRPAGDPRSGIGLHITLVRPEFYGAFRRETKAQAGQNRLGTFNTRKMFIDPLGPESPIRCQ